MPSTQVHSRPDSMIETMFMQHRNRACRYARWLVGNDSDAEEIVQEAFLKLAKRQARKQENATEQLNADQLNDHAGEKQAAGNLTGENEDVSESRFAGLLFTTIRNLCIDLLRKKGRRKNVSLTTVNEPVDRKGDDATAERLNGQIGELISELPENWAEALKLKITGDLSYDEIAAVLECTKAQVRTWIFRARRQLANELTKLGWLENQI